MNTAITGIKTSDEKALTQFTTTQSSENKKASSQDSKSTKNQTKTDTLELSASARIRQSQSSSKAQVTANAKTATQQSVSEQAKQLYQQGQTVAQIAAKLGVDVATVNSYLGIIATSTDSSSNSQKK